MTATPELRPVHKTAPPNGHLEELRKIYNREGANFEAEEKVLSALVPKLIEDLELAKYILQEPKFLGSTATIWLVVDPQLDRTRALKLPRPRNGKIRRIINTIEAERKQLSSLSHQNLAVVYFASDIKAEVDGVEYSFPYFIMDFFEGVKDLDKFILGNRTELTGRQVIESFHGLLSGLRYLHEKQIVHCDIKPGNLLVAPQMPPLVSDLGYAKDLSQLSGVADIEILFTEKYAHPKLLAKRAQRYTTDPQACRAILHSDHIDPRFDLFALGRSIQEILSKLHEEEQKDRNLKTQSGGTSIFTEYQWAYLDLIAKRLLDGHVEQPDSDRIGNLPNQIMQELAYDSAAEALQDVDKLLNLYDLEGQIPELNPSIATYIRLPEYNVPLTERIRAIVNHESFRRLEQISQLGFLSLVYPGATHSRFEHALGTFAGSCEYVRALWYDETNCLFRSVMSQHDLELVLLAALLHDVGQYPMAHDLAEASDRFKHEAFTRQMLERVPSNGSDSLRDIVEGELWNIKIDDLIRVIIGSGEARFKDRILHSIVSGPLDCDKVDYLRRDAVHLGVPFGSAVDHERFLRNLTLVYEPDLEEPSEYVAEVAVTEKARTIAQSTWRVRHDMFTQVYWQHSVRSMKAMLSFVLRRMARSVLDGAAADSLERDLFLEMFHELLCGNYGRIWALVAKREQDSSIVTEEEVIAEVKTRPGQSAESTKLSGYPSGLSVSDDTTLALLWCFADDMAKHVIHAIRRRDLYRRVAVLSSSRDRNRYHDIYGPFRTDIDREHLVNIETMREQCESRLLSALRRKLFAVPQLVPPDTTANDVLADITRVKPLVLVDVPVKAAAEECFRYVPEDVLRKHSQPAEMRRLKQTSSAKESVSLGGEAFDIEVGKIRVFVSPDWSEFVSTCLKDEEIMNCVKPLQSDTIKTFQSV